MGQIFPDKKVKLFCGILSVDKSAEDKAFDKLVKKFGAIDMKSASMPFDYSAYYNDEMGADIKRYWISFENLIFSGVISDIKVFTNSIEDLLAVNSKRIINIDPGYIAQSNVVLATTKNYSHRIYLSKGIYAEVTTIYSKKDGFIKLPWTYPDYLSPQAKDFLNAARKKLLERLKIEKNCALK